MARCTDKALMLPTLVATARAVAEGIASGALLDKVRISVALLLQGDLPGIAAAFALTTLALSTRFGRELRSTLTAMFNPLPAIALLPLALLWLGLGPKSLVFVLVHSVPWPLALATDSGFQGVPEVLRMAGRDDGRTGLDCVILIGLAVESGVFNTPERLRRWGLHRCSTAADGASTRRAGRAPLAPDPHSAWR